MRGVLESFSVEKQLASRFSLFFFNLYIVKVSFCLLNPIENLKSEIGEGMPGEMPH